MKNIQSITVDVVPGLITQPKVNVIRGDSETRYIDVTAVSYTHLDVYKRQQQYRSTVKHYGSGL